MSAPKGKQQGIALVLVLWSLVLLTTIAGSISMASRTELSMTRNLVDEVRGRGLVDAGFAYVMSKYVGKSVPDEDLPADGRLREWQFDGVSIKVGLVGESAKINLNMADEELLLGGFLSAGIEQEEAESLRDAVMDWRDADDIHRLLGAEDPEYENEGYSYGAADKKFESVTELGLVMGMTQEVMTRVEPLFTVYSNAKTINPDFASREVLLSIPGISEELVDQFIADREANEDEDNPVTFPFSDQRFLAKNQTGVYRIFSLVDMGGGHQVYGEMVVDLRSRGIKKYQILQVRYNPTDFPVT